MPEARPELQSKFAHDSAAAMLFEHAQDLFLLTAWDTTILEVNPAWERMLGWTTAQLVGRPGSELAHPDDRQALADGQIRLKEEGATRLTFRVQTAAGAWRWIDGRAQLVEGNRILGILRDVTNIREREAERQHHDRQAALLAERAGVVPWTLDAKTRILTRQRAFDDALGGSDGRQFSVDGLRDDVHPEDYPGAQAAFDLGMDQGVGGALDVRVRSKGGGWRLHRVNFSCELRDGRYILHGLTQDVTELVAARDAALAAEAEVRRVLEEAPFASAILGCDLRYISVSNNWRELFHIPGSEFPGKPFGRDLPPPLRRRLVRCVRRALAGEVVSRSEEDLSAIKGEPLIVRWQARPWRTPEGQSRGVLIYATDITDMVAVRRSARFNAKRLKLALEAANAAVFEVDYTNQSFWSGPGFAKLAGRPFTFKDARSRWPTVHPDDRARVSDALAHFDPRNPAPIDARLMTAEGPRWARCHMRIQPDAHGHPRRTIGLIQDIDAQKRQAIALEEAERRANVAADAKSNFLANISHEIRTPMNGVLGVLQLLDRRQLSEDEARLLDEALASGRMLSEMLDDLLDFSKIETGQFELHNEAVDPSAVLLGVASLLEPAASAKGLRMKAMAAPDLGLVNADPLRLRQALYNLMGNAVKFTPQGSIEARLTRRVTDDGEVRLRFEVQDTGIGVPESAQATLFERFEQADGSATRRFGGSGLGLAITKRLAERMGGAVGFSSKPGLGSTFWIEIDGRTAEPVATSEEAGPDIAEFRVLLVEDNPTNRLVISKILEALGVTVETAEDGAAGVQLASTGRYDLVLMDIQMPGMDGLEATRRIRALDGPQRSTPIVAVTANVLADQRTSYADAGMDGVVSKPVSAGALMAEIARVAERSAHSELRH